VHKALARRRIEAPQAANEWRYFRSSAPALMGAAEGEDAVDFSMQLGEMKDAEGFGERGRGDYVPAQHASDRSFVEISGAWIDTDYLETMPKLSVKFGSRAYFALVKAYPELSDAFGLGDKLTVCIDGVAVVIGDEGAEEMTEREIKAEIARLSP